MPATRASAPRCSRCTRPARCCASNASAAPRRMWTPLAAATSCSIPAEPASAGQTKSVFLALVSELASFSSLHRSGNPVQQRGRGRLAADFRSCSLCCSLVAGIAPDYSCMPSSRAINAMRTLQLLDELARISQEGTCPKSSSGALRD